MADSNSIKLCECGCGQPAPISKVNSKYWGLVRGQPMRFVLGHARAKNLTNRRFGNLVALRLNGTYLTSRAWLCRCDCGKEITVPANGLTTGNTKSCGCMQKAFVAQANSTHGLCYSAEYQAWQGMHARCYDKQASSYKNYGGRGIKVCERWHTFEDFYADVGERPSQNHSLDRYPNNNGDYEPGNVRWATAKQQARNTRVVRKVEYQGSIRPLMEWAEILGIKPSTLSNRYNNGERPPELFRRPAYKRPPRTSSSAS